MSNIIEPTILTQNEEIEIRGVVFDIKRLLKDAYQLAQLSPDPSTQNGALLFAWNGKMIGSGVNAFPMGVEYTPERWERPLKYEIIEHAERNAIFSAARQGNPTEGAIMICPWAACANCGRAIINSGITTLISHKQSFDRSPGGWLEQIKIAFEMMHEAKINIIWFDGEVGAEPIRHSGQIWEP